MHRARMRVELSRCLDTCSAGSSRRFPLSFCLLTHAAPGAPAALLLSDEASAADIAEARHRWGLDQPIYVQYLRFLANMASGDLGTSFKYFDPVISMLGSR